MTDAFKSVSLRESLRGTNLYLVGMMGSGKSKTGPFLAQHLSYSFVDSDVVLEKSVGKSITQIFNEDGETVFREIETQVLQAIGERHSLVVATGGGVVIRSENWGVLQQGVVIWINPSRDQILARFKNSPNDRPLLNSNQPGTNFDSILSVREKFYEEADLHITVENESPEEVATKILELLPTIIKPHQDPSAPQTTAN